MRSFRGDLEAVHFQRREKKQPVCGVQDFTDEIGQLSLDERSIIGQTKRKDKRPSKVGLEKEGSLFGLKADDLTGPVVDEKREILLAHLRNVRRPLEKTDRKTKLSFFLDLRLSQRKEEERREQNTRTAYFIYRIFLFG